MRSFTPSLLVRLALLVVATLLVAHAGVALDLGPGEWVETPYATSLCLAQNDPNDRCQEWCHVDPITGVATPSGIVCVFGKGSTCDASNIISKGGSKGTTAG